MIESVITLSLIGFAAGFLLSVPVAGPIAALIVSSALRDKLRYAIRVAIGSSFVEFFYVFLAMFGVTYLMKYYQPFIPYLFIAGGVLIIVVAFRIFRVVFKISEIDEDFNGEQKGGLRAGIAINATNPTLFFGWLTTSFIILSFASSVGLNTGGLDVILEENVTEISHYTETELTQLEKTKILDEAIKNRPRNEVKPEHAVILSFFYALSVSIGSFVWFFIFSRFVNRHRAKINTDYLNYFMKAMGVFLFFLSGYFLYMGVKLLLK